MDYEYESRKPVRWLQAELPPPKKEVREKKLSVNIQKFLARKEEEQKEKQLEAERKRQELVALRSQDKKSLKRVQSMLKRTKSANKSVLEDATDHVNTAVTAAGPLQPDEDDYGYVSKDASDLYDKLISKYNSMPAEGSPFSKALKKDSKDISSTKDRVKAALQREEDDKLYPKKRRIKSEDGNSPDCESEFSDKEAPTKNDSKTNINKFKIPKKNSQLPPPPDFETLLKLADQKKNEPVIIQRVVEDKPDRPMTKREKEEYKREQERKLRREMKVTSINNKFENLSTDKNSSNPSTSSSVPKTDPKKLQKQISDQKVEAVSAVPKKPVPHSVNSKLLSNELKSAPQKLSTSNDRIRIRENVEPKAVNSGVSLMKKTKEQFLLEQRKRQGANHAKERERILEKRRDIEKSKRIEKVPKLEKSVKVEEKKNISSIQSIKQFPSKDRVSESSLRDKSKRFPPKDIVRQFPPSDIRKPPPKPMRRQVIESDEEYDSEMDDFIDDSEDTTDISRHISEIFGYDRKKYANVDNDEECMESNFTQLQKEEFISTKYGILEDLADVRRTKLEKSRKKKRP